MADENALPSDPGCSVAFARRLRSILRWATVFCGIFPIPVFALDPQFAPSHYVVDRWGWTLGFPEETIAGITQSHDGLLWVAHANGLVRFNGSIAVPARWPAANAMDRSLRAIHTDAESNVWGLTVTGTVIRIPSGAPHPTDGTDVQVVYQADAWLRVSAYRAALVGIPNGVRAGGPLGVVDHTAPFGRADPRIPNFDRLTALAFDHGGVAWTIGVDGLLKSWKDPRAATEMVRLPPGPYDRLLVAAADRVWLRSRDLLICWCQGTVKRWALPVGFTNSSAHEPILEDIEGAVWLGGRGGLIRLYQDRLDYARLAIDLDETPVTALHQDREGALWIGTLNGDLIRFRDSPVTTFGREEGMIGDTINSILQERSGTIWTHAMNRGLTAWRGRNRQGYPLKSGNLWYAARDAHTGEMIIGSGARNFRLVNGNLSPIADSAEKVLGPIVGWWLNPLSGDWFLSRSSGLYIASSLTDFAGARRISTVPNGQIFAAGPVLGTGPTGIVWSADAHRLHQWSPDGESILTPAGQSADELVHSIAWDAAHRRVWVGTNRGLIPWNLERKAWDRRGMEGDSIFSLQIGLDGTLWAGTRNGIVRIEPAKWLAGDHEVSLRITHAEGLRSLNFGMSRGQGSAVLPDGRLLFASMKGVVLVNPRDIPSPRFGPVPIISELEADDEEVPIAKKVTLAPGSSRLKISFDAFSISTPRLIEVSYLLEGVDSKWQKAGARRSI